MNSRVLKLKKIQHGIPVYRGKLVEPVPVTEIAEHSKKRVMVRRGKRVRLIFSNEIFRNKSEDRRTGFARKGLTSHIYTTLHCDDDNLRLKRH